MQPCTDVEISFIIEDFGLNMAYSLGMEPSDVSSEHLSDKNPDEYQCWPKHVDFIIFYKHQLDIYIYIFFFFFTVSPCIFYIDLICTNVCTCIY